MDSRRFSAQCHERPTTSSQADHRPPPACTQRYAACRRAGRAGLRTGLASAKPPSAQTRSLDMPGMRLAGLRPVQTFFACSSRRPARAGRPGPCRQPDQSLRAVPCPKAASHPVERHRLPSFPRVAPGNGWAAVGPRGRAAAGFCRPRLRMRRVRLAGVAQRAGADTRALFLLTGPRCASETGALRARRKAI